MLSPLPQDRRSMLLQLTRFAISGALVTALGVGVYAVVALVLRWNPQFGNFLAYAIAVTTGYLIHSRWSFRGHGGQRDHRTKVRFMVVSVISYGLNSSWVWLFTKPLHLGPAWPMLPMVFVTPVVTFTLNRQWVFR